MSTSWPQLALDDALEVILDRRGVTPLKLGSTFQAAGRRVISAKLMKNRTLDFTADEPRFVDDATYAKWMRTPLRAGDVLLTSEAPLGETAFLRHDVDWCLGQRLFALRPRQNVLDGRFLFYALTLPSVREDLLARATGTTVLGIRQSELRRVSVPTPPLSEQRAIASILGALDDKIELNRRMNETLEGLARALFKSWFIDFDPVRAKAAGRQPVGMDAETARLFPSKLVASELGEIPSGWPVGSILERAKLMSGGIPKTDRPDYWNGGVQWASAKDVSQAGQSFLVATERTITSRGLQESATQMIPALGTAIVARGATTGRMVMFGREMAMNQTCYAVVSTIDAPFALDCQLRSEIGTLVQSAHGSVFDTITTNTFGAARTVLADPVVVREFEARVQPMFRRVLSNSNELSTLATLRDTLLPKLLSGEVRVRDAERAVEAAT